MRQAKRNMTAISVANDATWTRFLKGGVILAAMLSAFPAAAQDSAFAGVWDMTRDGARPHCRVALRSEKADDGSYFLGVSTACRHLMSILAKAGRWTPDGATIVLKQPNGTQVANFAPQGDGFAAQGADGLSYRLVSVPTVGRNATAPDLTGAKVEGGAEAVIQLAATKKQKMVSERPSDMAGRYAILREKGHDTGCMLTLDDKTRVKGGDRAALAPACRDQGIVVFDPVAWQIVNGRLVLTAKAGHVTHLDKQPDGTWAKDATEGKPLGLKKL